MRKGKFSKDLSLSLRKVRTSSTNPMPGVPQTTIQGNGGSTRIFESVAWQKMCTCFLRTEQKIKVQLYMVPVGLAGPVLFLDK